VPIVSVARPSSEGIVMTQSGQTVIVTRP
jgi:hypothetical protein